MLVNLKIEGMGCSHCVESVKNALKEIKNIKIIDVKLGEAQLEIENEEVLSEIREKLDDVGYDIV